MRNHIIFITILILSHLCYADYTDYVKTVGKLKQLLNQKNERQSELVILDKELTKLQNTKQSWLTKTKNRKNHFQKSIHNDEIFTIIKEISGLRKQCTHEFNTVYSENFKAINSVIETLKDESGNQKILSELLDLKSQRDFIIDSQQYFSSIDGKTFLLNQNFDVFNFQEDEVIIDFISLLNLKIQTIETARSSAKKEIKIRNKLNNFRTEISAIEEPETYTFSTESSESEEIPTVDSDYEIANDEFNYDNTTRGLGEDLDIYNTLTSENDSLLLFKESDESSLNGFITQMDSLEIYYKKLIQELSNKIE